MTALPPRPTPALTDPPDDLSDLPTTAPAGGEWYREHQDRSGSSDRGCWYFSSRGPDPALSGRFDAAAPHGTCYFADHPLVAALERVGRFTARRRPIPEDLVLGRIVTTVPTSALPSAAGDLLDPRAATQFGVTTELFTTPDYATAQRWARNAQRSGHDALIYTPRFSPSGRAVAVFGVAGAHPGPTASILSLREVLVTANIAVTATPLASALTILPPP